MLSILSSSAYDILVVCAILSIHAILVPYAITTILSFLRGEWQLLCLMLFTLFTLS
jgi:hypothetical protein